MGAAASGMRRFGEKVWGGLKTAGKWLWGNSNKILGTASGISKMAAPMLSMIPEVGPGLSSAASAIGTATGMGNNVIQLLKTGSSPPTGPQSLDEALAQSHAFIADRSKKYDSFTSRILNASKGTGLPEVAKAGLNSVGQMVQNINNGASIQAAANQAGLTQIPGMIAQAGVRSAMNKAGAISGVHPATLMGQTPWGRVANMMPKTAIGTGGALEASHHAAGSLALHILGNHVAPQAANGQLAPAPAPGGGGGAGATATPIVKPKPIMPGGTSIVNSLPGGGVAYGSGG